MNIDQIIEKEGSDPDGIISPDPNITIATWENITISDGYYTELDYILYDNTLHLMYYGTHDKSASFADFLNQAHTSKYDKASVLEADKILSVLDTILPETYSEEDFYLFI